MAYYVLLIRRRPTAHDTQPHLLQWDVEFGDYDRECVEYEQGDFEAHNRREFMTKIVKLPDARTATLNAKLEALNAAL